MLRHAEPMSTRIPQPSLRETCRAVDLEFRLGIEACIPLWPLHAERLAEGGCSPAKVAEAVDAVLEALAGYRPEVGTTDSQSPGGTQARPSSRLRVSLLVPPSGRVTAEVVSRLSSLDVPGGPRIAFVRVDGLPALPPGAAKPSDRSYWDDALRRALPAQQAVLVDTEDLVIDGGTASVWAVFGDTMVTPPAPPAIAGVARRYLLRNAHRLGLRVGIAPLTREDAERADELLLTNAFGGAVAARGRGGPVSASVAELFRELWRPRRAADLGEHAGQE